MANISTSTTSLLQSCGVDLREGAGGVHRSLEVTCSFLHNYSGTFVQVTCQLRHSLTKKSPGSAHALKKNNWPIKLSLLVLPALQFIWFIYT